MPGERLKGYPSGIAIGEKGLWGILPVDAENLAKSLVVLPAAEFPSPFYQRHEVKEVTDFRWTRSQRVQSNSVTSLRLQKRSPTLIGIALQVNRAESLHCVFFFLYLTTVIE